MSEIEAFLAGSLSLDSFRGWIDAYDWDATPAEGNPAIRDAMGQLELAFHEFDDGMITAAQTNELVARVGKQLQDAASHASQLA